jgi:DNA polymerase III subunit alpha
VNQSGVEFGVLGDKITYGMTAIKGVGGQAVGAIVEERTKNGPFKDIFDLAERVDPKQLTKGLLEILIKAGALDSFGPTRAQHLAVVDRAIQNAASRFRDKQSGQKNLFGGDEAESQKPGAVAAATPIALYPDVPDMPHSQKLAAEKEAFGFYLSSHPLTEYADVLARFATHFSADLSSLNDGAEVRLGGMISSIKRTNTKKPSRNGHTRYANFDFEDTRGIMRCIMWPEDFAKFGEQVQNETICFLEGKVDRRGREPNLIVNTLITIEEAERRFTDQVAVKFQKGLHSEEDIVRAREIMRRFPGRCDVALVIETTDTKNPDQRLRIVMAPGGDVKVAPDPALRGELQQVLGSGNVMFIALQKKRAGGNGHASNGNGRKSASYA